MPSIDLSAAERRVARFRVFLFGWLQLRRVALSVALMIVQVCCGGPAVAQSLGSAVPAAPSLDFHGTYPA